VDIEVVAVAVEAEAAEEVVIDLNAIMPTDPEPTMLTRSHITKRNLRTRKARIMRRSKRATKKEEITMVEIKSKTKIPTTISISTDQDPNKRE
jgi:hypothetical protein